MFETALESFNVAPASGMTEAVMSGESPSTFSDESIRLGTVASDDRVVSAATCAGAAARANGTKPIRPSSIARG